jgi:hypothetical protein
LAEFWSFLRSGSEFFNMLRFHMKFPLIKNVEDSLWLRRGNSWLAKQLTASINQSNMHLFFLSFSLGLLTSFLSWASRSKLAIYCFPTILHVHVDSREQEFVNMCVFTAHLKMIHIQETLFITHFILVRKMWKFVCCFTYLEIQKLLIYLSVSVFWWIVTFIHYT